MSDMNIKNAWEVSQLKNKVVSSKNKKKKGLFPVISTGTAIVVLVFCVVSIVSSQSTISEKKKELQLIEQKTEELEAENIEYQRIIDNDDINTYMEKYATENPEFNYGIPKERRFYDTSRN